MPATSSFSVTASRTERLDKFLADQLSISRTQAGRLIASGSVTVNRDPARASRRLERGDLVEVTWPEDQPVRVLDAYHLELDVVHEDDHLLVVDKPAGLVVHPAPGHWQDTLVNALAARGTELSQRSEGRPGIVHRLDKDTSGLMVIAKTDEAHRRLSRDLSRRKVERWYAALVWGHVPSHRDIEEPIARHPTDRKRMTVLATGRAARTEVTQVARFGPADLIRARLHTGRTHQIRVHLAHVGHPLLGDPTYGGGGAKRISGVDRPVAGRAERAVPRQALHAALLRFTHPVEGHSCEFRSEWPSDLGAVWEVFSAEAGLLDSPQPLEYLGFFDR